jgi:hypothetical protein
MFSSGSFTTTTPLAFGSTLPVSSNWNSNTFEDKPKSSNSREVSNLEAAIDTLAASDMKLVNWSYFSGLVLDNTDFTKYKSFINWKIASINIDIDTAVQLKEHVDWRIFLYTHDNVDVSKIKDVVLDWNDVLKTQRLDETEIVHNMYRLDTHSRRSTRKLWRSLCKYQTLSEQFMTRFWCRLDKNIVAHYQQMSYKFILKHIDELDIDIVRRHQDLKEWQIASLSKL